MGEDAKKQYVTVTGEGLTIHGWKHVTLLVGHITLQVSFIVANVQSALNAGLAGSQQKQGDIPHWSIPVHRETQGDNRSKSLGTATFQRCTHSCSINSVGWLLQATQHCLGQWFQHE
eukprot:3879730-Amphidinium_carterae.1